jgi:hypothetical protein
VLHLPSESQLGYSVPSSSNTPRGNIENQIDELSEHYDSNKPLNEDDFM